MVYQNLLQLNRKLNKLYQHMFNMVVNMVHKLYPLKYSLVYKIYIHYSLYIICNDQNLNYNLYIPNQIHFSNRIIHISIYKLEVRLYQQHQIHTKYKIQVKYNIYKDKDMEHIHLFQIYDNKYQYKIKIMQEFNKLLMEKDTIYNHF